MSEHRIANLGQLGLNTDIGKTLLPENVVTLMQNVLPQDNSLVSAPGEYKLFDITIEPVYHSTYVDISNKQWYIVSNGIYVHAYDSTGYVEDITVYDTGSPPAPTWSAGFVTFTNLNGVLIVNSESNGPFYWPGPAVPEGGTPNPLAVMTGWDYDHWRCKQMISHRYGLFALGMTMDDADASGNTYFPYKLRWSNSAQEGSYPTSWDGTDLSLDAGDDILGDTSGIILGGARVRDRLYIIKEDAIYQALRIDGQYIYAINRLQGTIGTTAPHGWCEVQGGLVVFTSTDILFFDGQTQVSLTDGKVARGIFENILEGYFASSEVYYHQPTGTLWVGFVSNGIRLSEAYVYDTEKQTWGQKRLNQIYGFDTAFVTLNVESQAWDDATLIWDSTEYISWDNGVYQPSVPDIIIYETNGLEATDPDFEAWASVVVQFRALDSSDTPIECIAQRSGLLLSPAPNRVSVINVWPEMSLLGALDDNVTVKFQLGMQETLEGDTRWSKEFLYNPQTAYKFDPRISGRYLTWRMTTEANVRWKLSAITFEFEDAGKR